MDVILGWPAGIAHFHGFTAVAELKTQISSPKMVKSFMNLIPIDAGNRIQLPAEWAALFHLRGFVALEKTDEGILVRPSPAIPWDDIFADKLPVGNPGSENESLELSTDDLLF